MVKTSDMYARCGNILPKQVQIRSGNVSSKNSTDKHNINSKPLNVMWVVYTLTER